MTATEVPNNQLVNRLGDQAEWHRYDWYNGNLKTDERIITANLDTVSPVDKLHKKLSKLSEENAEMQLSLAKDLRNYVDPKT